MSTADPRAISVPVASLVDDFASGLDRVKWAFSSPDAQTYWDATNHRVGIQCTGSFYTLLTDLSAPAYGIAGSSILAKVTPTTPAAGRETHFELVHETARTHVISFLVYGTNLIATTTPGSDLASVPYDPVAHQWLRIRHSATPTSTLYWDTSPDGRVWTNFASTAFTYATDAWAVNFSCGGTLGPDMFVDNVNVIPFHAVDLAGSSDGSSSATGTLAGAHVGVAVALAGTSAGSSSATGTLTATTHAGALSGTSGGHGSAIGTLSTYRQTAFCVFLEAWFPGAFLQPARWKPEPTCDVRSITIDRGRSTYLDSFSAGSLSATLADFNGYWKGWGGTSKWPTYDPTGLGRVTSIPIRVRVLLMALDESGNKVPGSDVSALLFTGTTDRINDSWPGTVDAIAAIQVTDGFKLLARHNGGARTPVGSGELTGARINRLADDGAWPTNASPQPWLPVPRKIDAGLTHLQGTDLNGVTLDLMRTVGEAEWGWLYMDETGALVFRQRDTLQTDPRMTTVQWTFVDADTVLPDHAKICYGDLSLVVDEDTIINSASITPPGVANATSTDAASSAFYGPRTWTRTDLPISTQAEALGTAQVVVLEYKDDSERIESITFDALHHGADHLRCAALCKINDRIRLVRTFPGNNPLAVPPYTLDTELIVQGIHHDITAGGTSVLLPPGQPVTDDMHGGVPLSWTVTLKTASARLVRQYGIWDQAPGGPPATAGWDVSQWTL